MIDFDNNILASANDQIGYRSVLRSIKLVKDWDSKVFAYKIRGSSLGRRLSFLLAVIVAFLCEEEAVHADNDK